MKELLKKIEELGVKERDYLDEMRDEYLYYEDDMEDLAVSNLGVHGSIVA